MTSQGSKHFRRRLLLMAMVLGAPPVARGASYSSTILFPISVGSGYATPAVSGLSQTSAGGQVVGSATASSGDHAFVWSTSINAGIDLASELGAGTVKSYAIGSDGAQQVGYAEGNGGPYSDQAMLWSSSAGSMVNLNPTNLPSVSASEAFGVAPGQQVGYGEGTGTGFNSHAMLWTGSAGSAVDLNPTGLGISSSTAVGTDGSQQVGNGSGSGGNQNALLWSSTADSAVNLNPTKLGFTISLAFGISGNQQVGKGASATISNLSHALLWNGTADSAVDLNPTNLTGFSSSEANDTNGSQQVGDGFGSGTSNLQRALLWSGTADSAVDLQSLLPAAGTWSSSNASTIDSSGNIYGIAKGSLNNTTGYFAVEWSPIAGFNRTDIGTGSLDLPNTSLTAETALVHLGYNNGNWNGTTGIMSTAAANDISHLTAIGVIQNNQGGSPIYSNSNLFEGQSPASTDILLKFTYYGDTNLDGQVDGSDYTRIDNGYLSNATLTGWFNGDFNYDGTIDGSDYTLIDNAYNNQGAQVTAALSTAQIADPVPEPTAISLLTMPMIVLLRRRRFGRGGRSGRCAIADVLSGK